MCKQTIYKAQCNGNDFILLLSEELNIEINEITIQKLCHRENGIGADGLIFIDTSNDTHDFKMDYYNCDGSWETMCANGALCCVLLLQSREYSFQSFSFLAGDGEHQITIINKKISITMKDPSSVTQEMNIQGFSGRHIDSGAKHFVTFCDERDSDILFKKAQLIRYDDAFQPLGLNVNFVSIKSDSHIDVVTYEKGIEKIMLSCGSGSVAAAFYASLHKKIISPLCISNRGGDMTLEFNKEWTRLWLTSNPVIEFTSSVDLDLINLN
jgi:diaminopimelate epimerase